MRRQIVDLLPNVTTDDLEDDDIVLDAVIVMRVVSPSGDGAPGLVLATTPDLDWILQVGLLQSALGIAAGSIGRTDDE